MSGRAKKKVGASNGYQTSFMPQLDADEPLEPFVVLLGDPRWDAALDELDRARYVQLDTEFYGPCGPWRAKGDIDYWQSRVRLIQVGLPSGTVLIFDLGGMLDDRDRRLEAHAPALARLRRVLEDPAVPVVGMALLTEYLLLRIHFGWAMRCLRDIMLMSQVVWAGVGGKAGYWGKHGYVTARKLSHSMAAIADRLGIPVDKTQQLSDWAGRLTNKQLNYAARDVVVPYLCFLRLGRMIREDGLLKSAQAECAAQPAFAECEFNGLPIDLDVARADLATWERVRDEFWAPFKKRFPGVNPGSPDQVCVVLTDALDWRQCGTCGLQYDPIDGQTRTYVGSSHDSSLYRPGQAAHTGEPNWPTCLPDGWRCPGCGAPSEGFSRTKERQFYEEAGQSKRSPSTSDDVLAPFERVYYVKALLEGRSCNTCLKWLEAAIKHARDGRIRTDYRQIAGGYQEHGRGDGSAGRGMGRSASGNPINLQNPSNLQPAHKAAGAPPIRRCIRPADDDFFLVADLSQAHMRIAAQMSQDSVLLRDFNAGHDAHLAMTHRLLVEDGDKEITFDQVVAIYATKALKDKSKHDPRLGRVNALRKGAKTCNYASLNLSGAPTMVKTASTMPEPVHMTEPQAKAMLDVWRGKVYTTLYSFQRARIREANRYRVRFDQYGLDGEYGMAKALTGRRFYMIKEWQKPREPGQEGRWSVKGTDCVSSGWMMTEADLIKYAMGNLVADFDAHPEWRVRWSNMAHDEIDLTGAKEYALDVARQVQKRFHEAFRWAGVTDLPVDEPNADPAKMLVNDWSDK